MNPITGCQRNGSFVIRRHLNTTPRERHIDRVVVKTDIEGSTRDPNPSGGSRDREGVLLVMRDIEPGAPCEQTHATPAISVIHGNRTVGIERH